MDTYNEVCSSKVTVPAVSPGGEGSAYNPIGPVTDSFLYSENLQAWAALHISEELKNQESNRRVQECNEKALIDMAKKTYEAEVAIRTAEEKERIRTNAVIDREALNNHIYTREGYVRVQHDKIDANPAESSPISCPIRTAAILQNTSNTEQVLFVKWGLPGGGDKNMFLKESDWSGLCFHRKLTKLGISHGVPRGLKVVMDGVLEYILGTCSTPITVPEHYGWAEKDGKYEYKKEGVLWKDIIAWS